MANYIKIASLFVLIFICALFIGAGRVKQHIVKLDKNICIVPLAGYTYRTCRMLEFKADGEIIIIPQGYKTDLASIPRPLWPLLAPSKSELMGPALLHDYLYEKDCRYDRKFADDIFFNALRANHVSLYDASKMYLAVRVFGVNHFKVCSKGKEHDNKI